MVQVHFVSNITPIRDFDGNGDVHVNVDCMCVPIHSPLNPECFCIKHRMHCLKYELVVSIGGKNLICDVCGPFPGSFHDKKIFDMPGGLKEMLTSNRFKATGDKHYVGAPPDVLVCFKKGKNLTTADIELNKWLSEVHAIERVIRRIKIFRVASGPIRWRNLDNVHLHSIKVRHRSAMFAICKLLNLEFWTTNPVYSDYP